MYNNSDHTMKGLKKAVEYKRDNLIDGESWEKAHEKTLEYARAYWRADEAVLNQGADVDDDDDDAEDDESE